MLPYVVRWRQGWRYRRRVPPSLKDAVGCSHISGTLDGEPGTRRFQLAYNRLHGEAEQRLSIARSRGGQPRSLTPHERLGVAGAWAQHAGWRDPDPTDPAEVADVLACLAALDITLPSTIPPDWCPPSGGAVDIDAIQRLVGAIWGLHHPSWVDPRPLDHQGEPVLVRDQDHAAALLAAIVQQATPGITYWVGQAHDQLHRLGVTVPPAEVQAAALRVCTAACALSSQVQDIEQGHIPQPLVFPAAPAPDTSASTFTIALARWKSLRSPATKTQLDAQARLQELAAHIGTDQLAELKPEHVSSWRDVLLQTATPATVKRRMALVRAVLKAATSDGLPVDNAVLERLGTPIAGSSGTTRQRRPFTNAEAALLWQISRKQQGPRPLDRWALPVALSIGCRLEELAGLRVQDVRQIDGQWVVVIEPHESRRLKNNNSARTVPIPQALVAEGFAEWAQRQVGPLLFPEPAPPAADPRQSHYASIRLGKLIRHQAGISDPAAVFHSTRHFVTQALTDADAETRVIESITGHASRGMVARYSRGGLPLTRLAAAQESRDWSWVPTQPADPSGALD